jgi:hypothetical protein
MTRENSLALLAALGMYFLGQIVIVGAPGSDSAKSLDSRFFLRRLVRLPWQGD